jgi:hypothetical protein
MAPDAESLFLRADDEITVAGDRESAQFCIVDVRMFYEHD